MTDLRSTFLTENEKNVIRKSGELWTDICHVVPEGPSRESDLRELIGAIHQIQRAILSVAAARAYPELYRPLGGFPPDVS